MPRTVECSQSQSIHILVKWCGMQMWDVYPIHALQDEELKQVLVLNGVQENKGRLVQVAWSNGDEPAPALLVDVGTPADMERLRKKVEGKHRDDQPNQVEQELLRVLKESEARKRENVTLKEKVDSLSNIHALSSEMQATVQDLKRLHKKTRKLLSKEALPDETVELVAKSGVFISSSALSRAKSMSGGNGCRLARDLMRLLFDREELLGKSMTGTQCNAHKNTPAKAQVDPEPMGAVLEYCRTACPETEMSKIKQSVRTFLQRLNFSE
ncbi:uncharacterized protein LOC135389569 [Ornithodoros turicata]|uniref:uncharacterized protein LOC135389569 n=1 Tax=Ornithodoros turicata TaxID=34597 RepID=UPI0031389791